MPATATQLPYVRSTAEKAGRGLWRKQVLPVGKVEHPRHGGIEFSREVLEEMVKTFNEGAMTQVPFCLVTDENRHSDDPERFRGEVRRLELSDDGLYAVIDPTERGEQLLRDNPRQPVSVRQVVPTSGPFAGRVVLAHVAATPDEVAKHMKDWEQIDASADTRLVDLSDGCFSSGGVAKDGTADTEGKDALDFSEEEKGALKSFFAKLGIGSKPEGDKPEDEPSDADFDEALAELVAEADNEPETGKDEDREPVAVSLSEEDRQALDMANERTRRFELKAGRTELSTRLNDFVKAGVPPAQVEAAREALRDDESTIIDLANDREPAAAKALFAALEAAKGTIEFSELGSATGEDAEIEAKLEAWEKQSG